MCYYVLSIVSTVMLSDSLQKVFHVFTDDMYLVCITVFCLLFSTVALSESLQKVFPFSPMTTHGSAALKWQLAAQSNKWLCRETSWPCLECVSRSEVKGYQTN